MLLVIVGSSTVTTSMFLYLERDYIKRPIPWYLLWLSYDIKRPYSRRVKRTVSSSFQRRVARCAICNQSNRKNFKTFGRRRLIISQLYKYKLSNAHIKIQVIKCATQIFTLSAFAHLLLHFLEWPVCRTSTAKYRCAASTTPNDHDPLLGGTQAANAAANHLNGFVGEGEGGGGNGGGGGSGMARAKPAHSVALSMLRLAASSETPTRRGGGGGGERRAPTMSGAESSYAACNPRAVDQDLDEAAYPHTYANPDAVCCMQISLGNIQTACAHFTDRCDKSAAS